MSTWIGFELTGPGVGKLEENSHDFDFEEDELHLTLAFLGQEDMYDWRPQIDAIVEQWLKNAVRRAGSKSGDVFKGTLRQCTYFGGSHVAIVRADPYLYDARANLVVDLEVKGIPVDKTFNFNPHITFGFQPDWTNTHLAADKICSEWVDDWGQEIVFPAAFVRCGEKRTAFDVDHSKR